MVSLVSFIQTTAYEIAPTRLRVPPILWSAFATLNKIHAVWRWFRRFELYRRPDNLVQLLAGHVVNVVVGEAVLLRIAAQCLLVATRLMECVQQQSALCRACKHWMSAVKGHYPHPVHVDWDTRFETGYFAQKALAVSYRLERIARGTFSVIAEMFKLSMHLMDVIDAFSWSPSTKYEGINEGFVNITKWLAVTVEHKEELLMGITKHRELIERLLCGSIISYDQLHAGVSKALEKTEVVYHGVKTATTFGGGILMDTLSNVCVIVGCAQWRPVAWASRRLAKQDCIRL